MESCLPAADNLRSSMESSLIDVNDVDYFSKYRMEVPRLEIFSMWFDYKDVQKEWIPRDCSDKCEDCMEYGGIFKLEKEDPNSKTFTGRIFIRDSDFTLHEIYNSAKVNSLYVNYPKKKEKLKLERVDDLLPLMGPTRSGLKGGMLVVDPFSIIVHRDSGNPDIDDKYLDIATPKYHRAYWIHADTVHDCFSLTPYNEPFIFKFHYTVFRSLKLDCLVFQNSKLLHVAARFIGSGRDVVSSSSSSSIFYICGNAVSSGVFKEKESVLFETPINKAIKVRGGSYIPLLRSVVAVPYYSDFTFKAQLDRPVDAADDDKDIDFLKVVVHSFPSHTSTMRHLFYLPSSLTHNTLIRTMVQQKTSVLILRCIMTRRMRELGRRSLPDARLGPDADLLVVPGVIYVDFFIDVIYCKLIIIN